MSDKLFQKSLLKGSQEFELVDDAVIVRIKQPLKDEKELQVMLAILNPEPVVNGNKLEFHSRVKCGPLLSLFLNNPNAEEFDAFVTKLKEKAQKEFDAFSGLG